MLNRGLHLLALPALRLLQCGEDYYIQGWVAALISLLWSQEMLSLNHGPATDFAASL